MNIFSFPLKIIKRFIYIVVYNPTRKIYRKIIHYSIYTNPKFLRLSSKPYISGDTFRKISDHIFDETKTLNVSSVKKNQIVFLKTDLKDIYFKEFHPKIQNEYLLITHNSDHNVSLKDMDYLDEKIIHWFSVNLSFKAQDKISLLPIGFENRRYQNNGKLSNLNSAYELKEEKTKLVLASFNISTNYYKRKELYEISILNNLIDNKIFNTPREYICNLKKYKFLLCPEGNGIDTHRIWESLLVNTVPIMLKSSFSKNLSSLGIPVFTVNSWSELNELSEGELNSVYEKYKSFEFNKYVKFDYWMNTIYSKKTV